MKSSEKAVRKKRHSDDSRARLTDMEVTEGTSSTEGSVVSAG